jgi:hypothetical protein
MSADITSRTLRSTEILRKVLEGLYEDSRAETTSQGRDLIRRYIDCVMIDGYGYSTSIQLFIALSKQRCARAHRRQTIHARLSLFPSSVSNTKPMDTGNPSHPSTWLAQRVAQNGLQARTSDKISRTSTLHPSIHPSIHPSLRARERARVCVPHRTSI